MAEELVILSGKGGTGKTSVVGSLAALAENKIMVDCDVDAADLHLIVGGDIEQEHEFIAGSKAFIDVDQCTACNTCVAYCNFDAIKYEDDADTRFGVRFWVDQYSCEGCGVCRYFCPDQAIEFNPVVSGRWFISRTRLGTLIHARLGIAEGNSGKLVSVLRKTAQSMAESEGKSLIITDGPPGIGCPAIATITGADYVLIVTEPSQSALHDMDRTIQLISNFSIPTGVCINKFDINIELTEEIENHLKEKGIPVLARIPFDPLITKAQIAGKPFVEFTDNDTSRSLKSLWNRLREELYSAQSGQVLLKAVNHLKQK